VRPRRWIVPALVAAALAASVLAYRHPTVMMQLSEQIWSCFG
jgi:hypothetical protein